MSNEELFCYESNKGWFNTAGYKLKWPSSYDKRGIGFNKSILTKNGMHILVIVEDKKYRLNTANAMNFIDDNDSYYKTGRTTLGVVSKSLMIPVN